MTAVGQGGCRGTWGIGHMGQGGCREAGWLPRDTGHRSHGEVVQSKEEVPGLLGGWELVRTPGRQARPRERAALSGLSPSRPGSRKTGAMSVSGRDRSPDFVNKVCKA